MGFPEVVDVGNFLVQFEPVGALVEPIPTQQVIPQHGGVFVGTLVFLQFYQGVYQVQKLVVVFDGLRVFQDFQEFLFGTAVTIRETFQGCL